MCRIRLNFKFRKGYLFSIGLLVFGLFGCKDTPYEIAFDQPELIINGVLTAGEVPRIFVGRTWSPTGKIPDQPYVENADVELLMEGSFIGKFRYEGNGMYYLPTYTINSGKSYVVKVAGMGIKAESRPVKVPMAFPLQKTYLDLQTEVASLNSWAMPRLLNITIKDYTEPGNFYGLSVTPYAKGYRHSGNVSNVEISNSSLDYREDDCFRRAPFWTAAYRAPGTPPQAGDMIIYNDLCFASLDKTFGIVIELYGTARAPVLFNDRADELRVQMAVLSNEYFEFSKTVTKVEGIENAFVEAKRNYTNIVGGHGVVAAMNVTRLTIPVKY